MLSSKIKKLIFNSLIYLPKDVIEILKEAYEKEESKIGKIQLDTILKNINIAKEEKKPLCQDTGLPIFFLDYGMNSKYSLNEIKDAINKAIDDIHKKYPIRPSLVDPVSRENLGYSDRPAWVHLDYFDSDVTKIHFLPKGAGSENVSFTKMMSPTSSEKEIIDYITQKIKKRASKSCPPIILGIGLGGSLDFATLSAKKALLTKISSRRSNFEEKIFNSINELNIGPMGLGGNVTCLDVVVKSLPCHTASLPLAVNVQCWCARRRTLVIDGDKIYEED